MECWYTLAGASRAVSWRRQPKLWESEGASRREGRGCGDAGVRRTIADFGLRPAAGLMEASLESGVVSRRFVEREVEENKSPRARRHGQHSPLVLPGNALFTRAPRTIETTIAARSIVSTPIVCQCRRRGAAATATLLRHSIHHNVNRTYFLLASCAAVARFGTSGTDAKAVPSP